jgi:uncharacterized membrane protein YeaQ/YmgE (transglycosylase-associated protein family)
MKIVAVLIVGFVLGLFAPEIQHFHFPKHLTVDPVAILLGAVFVFAICNMRGKRTANRKGGK